jgi:hypothetical protein
LLCLMGSGCVGTSSILTYNGGGIFSNTTIGTQASENGYAGPPPLESCSWQFLGLVAYGDSSIERARTGTMLKIGVFDYVDYSRQAAFGWSKFCTRMTGAPR